MPGSPLSQESKAATTSVLPDSNSTCKHMNKDVGK